MLKTVQCIVVYIKGTVHWQNFVQFSWSVTLFEKEQAMFPVMLGYCINLKILKDAKKVKILYFSNYIRSMISAVVWYCI